MNWLDGIEKELRLLGSAKVRLEPEIAAACNSGLGRFNEVLRPVRVHKVDAFRCLHDASDNASTFYFLEVWEALPVADIDARRLCHCPALSIQIVFNTSFRFRVRTIGPRSEFAPLESTHCACRRRLHYIPAVPLAVVLCDPALPVKLRVRFARSFKFFRQHVAARRRDFSGVAITQVSYNRIARR